MSAYRLNLPTKRGSVLNGVLFRSDGVKARTVLIAITGIHGNFYSNPFYYNFGDTLSANGIDFIYAQTNDAFNRIETVNAITGKPEVIGSYTDEDIDAYLDFAESEGYVNVVLAGHSLGANKVIYYLSKHHDAKRAAHFLLLSPANLEWLINGVSQHEKDIVRSMVEAGKGNPCAHKRMAGVTMPFIIARGSVPISPAQERELKASGITHSRPHTLRQVFSGTRATKVTGALRAMFRNKVIMV